jgi:hypothetical protein
MNVKNAMKGLKLFYPKPNLKKPRLVTIGLSHYSEKSRWALDISPLKNDYYEEMHCPAMHLTTTLIELNRVPRVQTWAKDSTFQQELDSRHSPKIAKSKDLTGVPKLVLPNSYLEQYNITQGGNNGPIAVVAGGSAGIVRLLADIYPNEIGYLYPKGSVEEETIRIEKLLDYQLGPAATSWSFGNIILTGNKFVSDASTSPDGAKIAPDLNQKSLDFMFSNITKSDIPTIERVLFRWFGKQAAPLMTKFNNISVKAREEARIQIEEVFLHMDKLLEKNNPSCSVDHSFLLGTEQLTAADIALSSLALPVLMPLKAKPFFTTREDFAACGAGQNAPGCTHMVELANNLIAKHISARYAIELYDHHRPTIDVRKN